MTLVAVSIEKDRILLISDCRVTLQSGARHDALQKVYPLGPNALVAFSGSVGLASSALRELIGSKGIGASPRLHTLAKRLSRIASRKSNHRRKTKGPNNIKCSFIITGYSGVSPYLATIVIDGTRGPKIDVARDIGSLSVIGSGEVERAACRNTILKCDLEGFTDDQAIFALGAFINGGMSQIAYPERYDEGIGSLKLSFVIRPKICRFIPQQTEMFRGRIADRNKPLGYAPVHSVHWIAHKEQFELHEFQSGSSYPLANVLKSRRGKYYDDLRGIVREDFDPYSLRA